MVQVDVFWAYSLGAGFAAAAGRQLKNVEEPFVNKYFVYTLLFLACLFAPSGVYLLWNFPHWETMQVATCRDDLPAWLVVIFAVTNITQGVLGFFMSWRCVRAGRYNAAWMHSFVGYFFMFFILVYGWDGTGWQRFLYDATRQGGVLWTPGHHMGLGFIFSNVAFTLYGMGVIIGPAMVLPMIYWMRLGLFADPNVKREDIPDPRKMAVLIGVVIFGVALASVFFAAGCSWLLAKAIGSPLLAALIVVPLFFLAGKFLLFGKGKPIYKAHQKFFVLEP